MSTQWSPRFSVISQWAFIELYGHHGLHQILIWFKTVYQWSLREAGFQWMLSDLPTSNDLSVICQQMQHFWWALLVGRSWCLTDLRWSLREHRWSRNECSMLGLSANAQRSQRSIRGLRRSSWNLMKVELLVPQWVLKDLQSDSTEATFWDILETAERSCPLLVSQWLPNPMVCKEPLRNAKNRGVLSSTFLLHFHWRGGGEVSFFHGCSNTDWSFVVVFSFYYMVKITYQYIIMRSPFP